MLKQMTWTIKPHPNVKKLAVSGHKGFYVKGEATFQFKNYIYV